MDFFPDRFSIHGPEWVKLGESEKYRLRDLIEVMKKRHSIFIGSIIEIYRVSGLEINSSNLKIEGSISSMVVKLLGSQVTVSQENIYRHIKDLELPAPNVLGDYNDKFSGRPFIAMEYINGHYFSGSKLDLYLSGKAIEQFHQGFSDYQIAGMPESIVLQSNSNEILHKFLATNEEWELKFGVELAFLLRQNADLIVETEAMCSARLATLLEADRSIFHTDLHPHNIIMTSDKAIIIDIDSLKVAGWPSVLGFCFYKLVRQAMVKKSIKNINLSDCQELFETISSSFVSQNNRVALCYLGALTEVLRRIIIIFEGNLDGGLSPWNQVLGIQVRALSEIRYIFSRFL